MFDRLRNWFAPPAFRRLHVELTVTVDGRTYRQGQMNMTSLSDDLWELKGMTEYLAAVIQHQIKNGHTGV